MDYTSLIKEVDIPELVKALRHCSHEGLVNCNECKYDGKEWPIGCEEEMMADAADAIEALQARLGEAENSVERWKDMYLTKHEPKRGEWVRVREVYIPGEIHPAAFRCMCSMCRNEYVFPRVPQYCPDCGAKMEVQDESIGSV